MLRPLDDKSGTGMAGVGGRETSVLAADRLSTPPLVCAGLPSTFRSLYLWLRWACAISRKKSFLMRSRILGGSIVS